MKKKIILYSIYFLFVLSLCLFSITFAKYVSDGKLGGGLDVGELYLGYQRGDLLRNDILIVGVEVTEDGLTRIETMNVKPNDVITYYFSIENYLANYDETGNIVEILKSNAVSATYKMKITAELWLPVVLDSEGNQLKIELPCQVSKEVDKASGTYTAVDLALNYELPAFSQNDKTSYFEQKYRVRVEDTQQLQDLTSKDYFGASLKIFIQLQAVQNMPILQNK